MKKKGQICSYIIKKSTVFTVESYGVFQTQIVLRYFNCLDIYLIRLKV